VAIKYLKTYQMIGQKNVTVFLVACAFALYQFRNAKNRADLSSPNFQMKKARQMIMNHLNMFDHKVYDAKTGRGDFELLIMTNEKDGKAPPVLGIITEDKAVTRARRNGRRNGHDYRRKKKRHHPRRRNGRKERHDHVFTPTLKLVKYDEKLAKVEYLLIRRGLITNVLNDKAKQTLSNNGGSGSTTKNIAQEKHKEESVKADSVKEIKKRETEKEAEESRKLQEQAKKKKKEQARKQKKKQESDEDTIVVLDNDGNVETVSKDNSDSK